MRRRLRSEYGEVAFENWLNRLDLANLSGDCLVLSAPSRFMRDWVAPRYGDRIRALWRLEDPSVKNVDIVVREAEAPNFRANGPTDAVMPVNSIPAGRSVDEEAVDALLDPKLTFENFVVGKPNEFAHAAARRVSESDDASFNPLFIYGGVGLGKTHLMQGIAWRLRQRQPQKQVMYLSAEKFMYRFVRALRFKNIMGFKELFRSVDVLMVDDVQFMDGKDATQEEFFHTFNALVEQGRQIVVSGDRSPSDLEGMEERMRSRLGCGLVAEVHSTSYELRLGILQAKAEELLEASVPDKVLEFLAHKITANVRELEGALNRVVAHATLVGRPISLDSAQEVLHDLLRAHERRVTIEDIQKRVSDYYNIRVAEMSSARRAQMVARPRQVAMYLAKQLTSRSLPEIGRKFGNRDHTTVMHAIKKVEQVSHSDPSFGEDVELLRRMLES
ncbi:MAG: chromosomal replication initiator protein DnaA [Rhodospirillaceae bacterium]|nr:chromosomal replication initiator protein DnaA [Rhodospirillaceae bacterium]